MLRRRIGTISFVSTLTVMLAAFALNAGPQDAGEAKRANAKRVNAAFQPSVADPTVASQWVDVGQGVKVRLSPVVEDEGYAVNVSFKRASGAVGEAAVAVELDCSAETLSPMGRVPVPMQVKIGTEKVKATVAAGEVVDKRVLFKVRPDALPALMAKPVASVALRHGEVVVKDAVYVAYLGAPVKPALMGGPPAELPAGALGESLQRDDEGLLNSGLIQVGGFEVD